MSASVAPIPCHASALAFLFIAPNPHISNSSLGRLGSPFTCGAMGPIALESQPGGNRESRGLERLIRRSKWHRSLLRHIARIIPYSPLSAELELAHRRGLLEEAQQLCRRLDTEAVSALQRIG